MSQERWRTASGERDAGRFTPPQVYDQDDEREKMTVTKAVGVFVTFIFGVVAGLAFYSFLAYHALNALGVAVSWIDALTVSVCFIFLRYFDLGIVASLRKKNRD